MGELRPQAGAAMACLLTLLIQPLSARAVGLNIGYGQCNESIGFETVSRAVVLPQLPADFAARFGFGGFGAPPAANEAQLIARTMRCEQATQGAEQLGPLVTTQVGVITARTDAQQLAGHAANGIDNWQLGYSTSSQQLDALLNGIGVASHWDPSLSFVQDPASGVFATQDSSLFATAGDHPPPSFAYPGGFIAHWWSAGSGGLFRSRQTIETIAFRFGGAMQLTPVAGTPLAAILGVNPVSMDIPLGGEFASGPVSIEPVPAPLPLVALPMALAWSRRLRRRRRSGLPSGTGCKR